MTALPTRKLEAWRYTDLRALGAASLAPVRPPALPALPDFAAARLVFVNGVFDAAPSTGCGYMQGFEDFAEESVLPLALINADKARDGAVLVVPPGVDAGDIVLFSYVSGGEAHVRHRVVLGDGAKLTLVEIAKGEGEYWHNPVFDISLGEGAVLAHYRLQDESLAAFHTATIKASLAAGAGYESFSAVLGARLSRAEFHVGIHGAGAAVQVNAAQLLGGAQHGDFTTVIAHKAPHCSSRQTVKTVLSGTARGVFQGRIEVDRVAQKTDGYQMNQALLLSAGAEMDIKPELQIFADDVKCSHGATIGTLDEEQVFYLRSRGIAEAAARALLIRAFLTEALEPVAHEGALALFETAFEDWWARL